MAKNGLRRRPRENRSPGAEPLKTGLAKWGLTLFISGWMFALGVLVGRGTMPVKFDIPLIQEKLAALGRADREAMVRRMESNASAEGSGLPDATDLHFHERLKESRSRPEIDFTPIVPSPDDLHPALEEEMARGVAETPADAGGSELRENLPEERVMEEPAGGPAGGPVENKTPLMRKPSHIARAAKTPSRVQSRSPEAKKAGAPAKPAGGPVSPSVAASALRGQAGGKYTLQVASFKLSEEAENMISYLQQKGYPAEHIRAVIHGKGIWHRVQVGAFASKTAAGKTLQRLKKEGFAPIIVSRDAG